MKIVNLTPHDVVLLDAVGNPLLTFQRSGTMARVETSRHGTPVYSSLTPEIELALPVDTITASNVVGLPEPDGQHVYIVSRMVAEKARRSDVIAPDVKTAETIEGRVTGVYRFISYN